MASIGSLTASLQLESASFIRNLNRAAQETAKNTRAMQSHMAGLQRSFATVATAAKGFLTGIVSVAAVRQLASLGRTAIEAADEIGEAATKIGISGEALQRFRFAAAQADVETEKLDNALRMFAQNLAQGKISAEGENMADAFRNYIDQISRAPTQLEKIRIAQEGVGKQWQTAMLLAAQGSEEFQQQADSAFVISERALEAASRLDNQYRALQDAVQKGFATGFIEAFGEGLGTTQEKLREMNRFATDLGSSVGTAVQNITNLLNSISSAYDKVKKGYDSLPEAIKRAIAGTSFVLNPVGSAAGLMAGGGGLAPLPSFEEHLNFWSDLNVEIGKSKEAIGEWKTTVEKAEIPQAIKEMDALLKSFGDTAASSFSNAIVEGQKFADTLKSLAQDIARLTLNSAFRTIFSSLLGSASGGGGILGSLFHKGGVVGQPAPMRSVPAALFAAAPRLHNGLMPDEFPAILQRGETVIPRNAAAMMGASVQVNVINNASGTEARTEQREVGGMKITDVIIETVQKGAIDGKLDSAFGARFGMSRRTTVR